MEAEIQGLLSFRLNLGAKLTLFLKPLLLELFLGYSQKRIGPNKLSFICLLQPMADAVRGFESQERPCYYGIGVGKICREK